MSDKKKVNEYRCTRNSHYMHPCFGQKDLSAREGHYILAASELEAMNEMAERFPEDRHGFTAQLWQKGIFS